MFEVRAVTAFLDHFFDMSKVLSHQCAQLSKELVRVLTSCRSFAQSSCLIFGAHNHLAG